MQWTDLNPSVKKEIQNQLLGLLWIPQCKALFYSHSKTHLHPYCWKVWSWSRYLLRRGFFCCTLDILKLCGRDKAFVSMSKYPLRNLVSSPGWKILASTPSSNLCKLKMLKKSVPMLPILHVVNVSKNWSVSEKKKKLCFLISALKRKDISTSVYITKWIILSTCHSGSFWETTAS